MTCFRPCIDLHEGKVKQIVGGSLQEDGQGLQTNFESDQPAQYYAEQYCRDTLRGGHVIQLGPNNEGPAREALGAYPQGLQVGGGIHAENAAEWLEAGASVIGGCCEVGPDHIKALSTLLQSRGHEQLAWGDLAA